MCKIAIPFHSTSGVTKSMAEQVCKGARSVEGASVTLIDVAQISDEDWQTLNDADAIIFGAPTYFGSASAGFKAFMDASSELWANQKWLDKVGAAFTTSGAPSGDKLQTLVQLMVFGAQHGMHWINMGKHAGHSADVHDPENVNRLGSWLGAMAQPCRPREDGVRVTGSDAATGRYLGKRVARITQQLLAGARTTA